MSLCNETLSRFEHKGTYSACIMGCNSKFTLHITLLIHRIFCLFLEKGKLQNTSRIVFEATKKCAIKDVTIIFCLLTFICFWSIRFVNGALNGEKNLSVRQTLLTYTADVYIRSIAEVRYSTRLSVLT